MRFAHKIPRNATPLNPGILKLDPPVARKIEVTGSDVFTFKGDKIAVKTHTSNTERLSSHPGRRD